MFIIIIIICTLNFDGKDNAFVFKSQDFLQVAKIFLFIKNQNNI